MPPRKRNDSGSDLSSPVIRKRSEDIQDPSPHSSFVHYRGFRVCYVAIVFFTWVTLHMFQLVPDAGIAWSVIVRIHAVLTFFLFHWPDACTLGLT